MASSKEIARKAIDASGLLGTLYDNRRHRILKGQNEMIRGHWVKSSHSSHCEIINGSSNTDFNLLKLIGVDDELRLYLLLKLTNRVGVASALNYERRIDEYTRILYYSYIDRKEKVKNMADVSKMLQSSDHQRLATHVITGIDLGIDLVLILQLPPESNATANIDRILEKIRMTLLRNDHTIPMLADKEEHLIEKNANISAYSNIPHFAGLHTICSFLDCINRIKTGFIACRPITYYLYPVTQLHPQYNAIVRSIPLQLMNDIEQYLLQLRVQIDYLHASCEYHTPLSFFGDLLNRFYKCQRQLSSLKNTYNKTVKQLGDKIIDLRNGRLDASVVRSMLRDNELVILKRNINQLIQFVCYLLDQKLPIIPLRQQSFNDHNPGEQHPHEANSTRTIAGTFERDDRRDRDFHANDTLNSKNDPKGKSVNQDSISGNRNSSDLHLNAANYRYPSKLVQNVMSPLNNIEYNDNQLRPSTPSLAVNPNIPVLPKLSSQIPVSSELSSQTQVSTELPSQTLIPIGLSPKTSGPPEVYTQSPIICQVSSNTSVPHKPHPQTSDPSEISPQTPLLPEISPQTPLLPEIPTSPTDPIINILLLGESGVGKSTFINAFVNYLSFDTFEQAELNQPVVLIPVSFLMTVGDNFEERTVKFGAIDDSKNEDFDHPGQSVTQHCKSYIFHLNDEKKLCIIDTPGFGDTRGIDRDDRNMQNILEYINNLDHLNAVCFLLKPNASRLNVFFRSCITQILDLLGPTICRNLAFCFTNARTTFYTPGDTAPLLKQMLQSLSIKDIPFGKENTFCFDNESFRYLVALRNEIPFTQEDQQEYAKSWSVAVKESNRLIDYILIKLSLYPKQGDWQSNKHAQLEINYMIRPILETMRNILRNIILQIKGVRNRTIELNPVVLHRSASLCLSCKPEKMQIENFFIIEDCPHEFQNTCRLNCPCLPEQHMTIDYMLEYKVVDTSPNHLRNNTTDKLDELCKASATFAHFLVSITHSTKKDPFEHGLLRMINQENDLCRKRDSNDFNRQLSLKLQELQTKYLQTIDKIKSNPERSSLPRIYQLMEAISKHPMVEIQMDAVRQGREIIMKQHENEHQEI